MWPCLPLEFPRFDPSSPPPRCSTTHTLPPPPPPSSPSSSPRPPAAVVSAAGGAAPTSSPARGKGGAGAWNLAPRGGRARGRAPTPPPVLACPAPSLPPPFRLSPTPAACPPARCHGGCPGHSRCCCCCCCRGECPGWRCPCCRRRRRDERRWQPRLGGEGERGSRIRRRPGGGGGWRGEGERTGVDPAASPSRPPSPLLWPLAPVASRRGRHARADPLSTLRVGGQAGGRTGGQVGGAAAGQGGAGRPYGPGPPCSAGSPAAFPPPFTAPPPALAAVADPSRGAPSTIWPTRRAYAYPRAIANAREAVVCSPRRPVAVIAGGRGARGAWRLLVPAVPALGRRPGG